MSLHRYLICALAVVLAVVSGMPVIAGGKPAARQTVGRQDRSGDLPARAQPAKQISGRTRPAKAKDRTSARPATASDLPPTQPTDVVYAGDTVTLHRNSLGQTVFSITASHFDISPPFRQMAASFRPKAAGKDDTEHEPVDNPRLPNWRIPTSSVPDPVVQRTSPAALRTPGRTQRAPTTGFNFLGTESTGSYPPDNNGSVGKDQFVETVNTRYQIWSLDRATSTATSILGPINIQALWAGFGGECSAQNSGDPIVIFDKLADRWLISQFTTGPDANGDYLQCVAVSQSSDATGTYARWAFAYPINPATNNHVFGDYPHFGLWSDAYYMMAHGFEGGYVGALFAAMDRPRMIAGDPNATWQIILDPNEGGHMPGDIDGFAPPPTNAPGVFLSLHSDGMAIYRMTVDFITPANTFNVEQARVPVAPSQGAGGIPQPGGAPVDSLGDRLMFRAGYRNFIDHESIVVSHSVDPSIPGVAAGARWYDIRLSGPPDPACPVYPCLYQQGTYAIADDRSRWMPSVAMDTAENILIGYSTSGLTPGTDNHSIRYTGRAKGDPLNTMTAPEVIIVNGTLNETSSALRWGDYTSMSVDPADDCTFWYVNQYYFTTTTRWSTRIASARWPDGSGPGECPTTTCATRPTIAPTINAVSVSAPNQLTVTWTGLTPAPGGYAIERAPGACGSEGLYQPLGSVLGTINTFADTAVQGGLTYSYRVIATADAAGKCQAMVASGCVDATATGTCNLRPVFSGVVSAASNGNTTCGVDLQWVSGVSGCPLTPALRYNVYRDIAPDFVPSAANRIASCIAGPTSYVDTMNLVSGATYYYVVRSEDNSTGNGGPCGGNEDVNSVVLSGTPYGVGTQPAPGTWGDGGGDLTSLVSLNVAGPGNTGDRAWRIVSTANDPGANNTPGGTYAYRNAGPSGNNVYGTGVCAEIQTPTFTLGATTTTLQYAERHQLEYHWDGVGVEYSQNGGPWTIVPAPSNLAAAGCSPTDDTTGWETLGCTQNPPINACGYPRTTNVYNGPTSGGGNCNSFVTGALTSYAHRCHPLAGLTVGDTIQFRWRFSSDPGAEFAGFYLDDPAVTNVLLPNTCTGGCIPTTVLSVNNTLYMVRNAIDPVAYWTSAAGASTYDIEVASVRDFSALDRTLTAVDPLVGTHDPGAVPAAPTLLFYRVRGVDSCGIVGP